MLNKNGRYYFHMGVSVVKWRLYTLASEHFGHLIVNSCLWQFTENGCVTGNRAFTSLVVS